MIFFHETEVWGKGLLKVLFFVKKNDQILNFKKKKFWIFSKEFTSEKFLWGLTLEKFSIFYQSLRDYNCGSNRCMVTCRVSKRISWTRRTFWEIFVVADCISGHFMKIWFSTIFDKKIWFLAKYGPFGRFGRPIGRCGQSHMNQLDFLSSIKFTISRNSQ